MKKFILLLFVLFAVFVIYNRQRLFLRDPLGSVMRDGVKEEGAQVFINYSNEVLIENDHAPMYVTVVQNGGRVGTPATLKCMHWMACLTDADVTTLLSPLPASSMVQMTGRLVEFRDATGKDVKVVLR